MKYLSALLLVLAAMVAASQKAELIDNYTLQQILTDDKLFQQYFGCFMGTVKCTPGGQKMKDDTAVHISTGCPKCTPEEKGAAKLIIGYMIEKRGPQYIEFEKKYDPQQKLRKMYAH